VRSLIVATLAVALLGGCANHQGTWTRDNASQQDFYMDRGQCKAQAFGSGGSLMLVAIVFNSCMQGKGWEQS
jgi:hypothetical protein